MLAATKAKLSGSEKKKNNNNEQDHLRHVFHKTCKLVSYSFQKERGKYMNLGRISWL